ncbi:hypothetical protein [Sediminibacterium sp. KACHI17]|jgi:hypothetical protein
MKHLFLFLMLFFSATVCLSQNVPIPRNYSIVDSIRGDLDKDGVDELVVAYNTKSDEEAIDDGVPRELIIYKLVNHKWSVWQKSTQALMGSRDGGMMGDPYGEMVIEKGILKILQEGGSSWKWNITDKYRYDGREFKLIGCESHYGKPCEYFGSFDFNLVTGKIDVQKEFERCKDDAEDPVIYKRQNEIFFKKGIVLSLQNRSAKDIMIVSPKYRHEIYIASKQD